MLTSHQNCGIIGVHQQGDTTMKKCTQCHKIKDKKDFYTRMSECKDCKNSRDTLRLREDPRIRMLATAKYRAKQKGIPFDITKDDFNVPEICPLLGIPIKKIDGRRTDNSPSLDRIDNTKGYVKGNVWVISDKANRLKNCLTLDILKMFVERIESKLGGEL